VNVVRVRVPDEDLEIVLVDTPGFDDTHKSDYEILKLIKDWLEQA
jgi:predicted GTPase